MYNFNKSECFTKMYGPKNINFSRLVQNILGGLWG